MKIVDSGYKIDLHIHSYYSHRKDGTKVSFNTIDNIRVLVEKLNENGVQICAITDHDAFNYDLYSSLKSYEQEDDCSIVKVFPGVEFSVEFEGDSSSAVVHVIAIFDDSDEEKIKNISNILNDESGKPKYDRDMAYSEEKFISILRDIKIDTVLIAHQKNTFGSKKPKKSDANRVGQNRFDEFVETDYFEAFEFKNRRNEVFNKAFLFQTKKEEDIRFITGSDCHDWRVYPKETSSDSSEFIYSYVKCLPTFRGLVMAITDHRRIKRVNSFFNVAESYLPEISITISDVEYKIPLSRGINVIIGDNSIGKSLLLHKLTGYCKKQTGNIKANLINSYDKYLKNNRIVINSEITQDMLFGFDMQGEVRSKFDDAPINSNEFLQDFYPQAVDPAPYRELVQRQLDKVYRYLQEKFEIESLIGNLGRFKLEDYEDENVESIVFINKISKDDKKTKDLGNVISSIKRIIEELHTVSENPTVTSEDKEELDAIEKQLIRLSERFELRKSNVDHENQVIGIFQTVLAEFRAEYSRVTSDSHKKLSAYKEAIGKAKNNIIDIIIRLQNNPRPNIEFDPIDIQIETYSIYNYEFHSRLNILKITPEYIWSLFEKAFKKDTKSFVLDMSQEELTKALLRYDGSEAGALNELKQKVSDMLDEDFKPKFTITESGRDKTDELSAGLNAKIYFDILSYVSDKNGIYIIDQPEDNISQKSIREYLLDRFKTMGERRQVIIVTHNPQFIVNLDVDNIVYLGRDSEGRFFVQSGALEYCNENYSILDIISTHIEGGLETLQKRWKRYEKNNRISGT